MRGIPVEHAQWIRSLLSQLTDERFSEAFRATDYDETTVRGGARALCVSALPNSLACSPCRVHIRHCALLLTQQLWTVSPSFSTICTVPLYQSIQL
jgi:hypothetical protein